MEPTIANVLELSVIYHDKMLCNCHRDIVCLWVYYEKEIQLNVEPASYIFIAEFRQKIQA